MVPTLMVGMNPGVQEGTLPILTKFVVFSAFLVAAVFEIKRLADQSSDENNY
jgi:predicted anti-sigma-YlaC factor YlaD